MYIYKEIKEKWKMKKDRRQKGKEEKGREESEVRNE